MLSSGNPLAVRLLSFWIVITDRKYQTDSNIISMSGLKKSYSKMSQMLDITTPRKSNFSEGAHLTEPPRRAFGFLLNQRLIQFSPLLSSAQLYLLYSLRRPWKCQDHDCQKKTVVDRHDIWYNIDLEGEMLELAFEDASNSKMHQVKNVLDNT